MSAGVLSGTRVVVANNFPGSGMGGGEVQQLPVAKAFAEAGAEVVGVVAPGSGFGTALRAAGIDVVETRMSLRSVRAAVRAIRAQIAEKPTVLVGTGYFTNILVRLAGHSTTARVVNVVGVVPGSSLVDSGSRAGATIRTVADRLTAARVDAWIAVSAAVADALVAGGAPASRVHVVPNGIDLDALHAAAQVPLGRAVPEGRPLVACVARLEPVKGVEHLVRAVPLVPGATFAILGEGSAEGYLRELSVALSVSNRVVFLGGHESAASLLAASDVVVVPSLSEGFGLVAAEAMALARPVVATRVGGLPEVVADQVSGIIVAPADPPALAAAIRRLVAEPEVARAMGEAGAVYAGERYTAQRMTGAYVQLVAALIASPPR